MVIRTPLFQSAYFVDSLDAAIPRWATTLDAGPFFVTSHHRADWFRYKGEPVEADVSYAFGYAGDVQIQLIEQHDDTPSIYRDMFGPGEYGHHHVAMLVHDYEAERDRLVAQGHELACELRANDVQACYFDTRPTIGTYTELHTDPDRIITTFARWKQAHLEWDRVDPFREHVSGT